VHYAGAEALAAFAAARHCRRETQAGKGALPWDHPQSWARSASPARAPRTPRRRGRRGRRRRHAPAGFHHRLAQRCFRDAALFQVNVQPLDAHKHGAHRVVGDALVTSKRCRTRWRLARPPRVAIAPRAKREWIAAADAAWPAARTRRSQRRAGASARCSARAGDADRRLRRRRAAGRAAQALARRAPGGYHLEYGYSCMGYEIAGGLGVKMARPEREVVVMVGDGST
jgi:3D-(3,5/4)-trihydroxycyclohexane-1,2-dione acylhydrolase (decyclizing)